MQVIATAPGFDGLCVRQPGETFEAPEGASASWFRIPDAPQPKPQPKAGKGKGDAAPKTLSEAAAAADTSGTPADLA